MQFDEILVESEPASERAWVELVALQLAACRVAGPRQVRYFIIEGEKVAYPGDSVSALLSIYSGSIVRLN